MVSAGQVSKNIISFIISSFCGNHIFICAKPFDVSLFQIGVHFGGTFYEFVPWNGVVEWEITQWGHWRVTADNETHKVIMP